MTDEFDVHPATEANGERSALLDDDQRAAFLDEWHSVQTGFATDPRLAAATAERLVATLADSVVRRIGEITDAVARPVADPSSAPDGSGPAGVPVPNEETWRQQVLRCREAFQVLIDS